MRPCSVLIPVPKQRNSVRFGFYNSTLTLCVCNKSCCFYNVKIKAPKPDQVWIPPKCASLVLSCYRMQATPLCCPTPPSLPTSRSTWTPPRTQTHRRTPRPTLASTELTPCSFTRMAPWPMLPSFPSTLAGGLGSAVLEEHWEISDDHFMKTLMTFWNNSPVQFSLKIPYPGYNLLIMNERCRWNYKYVV